MQESKPLSPTRASLNAAQLDASRATANAFVEASPGSGKTRLAAAKVQREIGPAVSAGRLLLFITYTRAARDEFANRIHGLLSLEEQHALTTQTMNGFCLSEVVMPFGALVCGFDVRLALPGGHTYNQAIIDAANEGGVDEVALKKLLRDAWRDDAGNLRGDSVAEAEESMRAAVVRFWEILLASRRIDHGTVLYLAVKILRQYAWIARGLAAKYAWVLVDEYQDCGTVQLAVLQELARQGLSHFFLVGDLQQSIYGFNGVDLVALRAFVCELGAKHYDLPLSFRCGASICTIAERISPRNMTRSEDAAPLTGEVVFTSGDAFRFVTHVFWPRCHSLGIAPSEQAILAPAIWILEQVVRRLRNAGHQIVLVRSIPENQWGQILVNAFITAMYAKNIADLSRASGELLSFLERFEAVDGVANSRGIEDALLEVCLSPRRRLVESRSTESQLEYIETCLFEIIKESKVVTAANMLSLRKEFATQRDSFIVDRVYNELLETTVERLSPRRSVRAMTINGAKGLEFDAVGIVGLNERILPNHRATTSLREKEELRKLYVAVTRARKFLGVNWDGERPRSRFIPILRGECSAHDYFFKRYGQ